MLQDNQAAHVGLREESCHQTRPGEAHKALECDDHPASLELLQVLLRPVVPAGASGPLSQTLLANFGSVGAVLGACRERLATDIGQQAAFYLNSIQKVLQHVLRERLEGRPVIGSWKLLEDYLSVALRYERAEKLMGMFLDRQNGLIQDEIVQQGTVDEVPSFPREIARRALQLDASAIIIVHNRPSGDSTPSRAEIDRATQIRAALAPLDIAMHDYAIVGRKSVTSLQQLGLI